MSEPTRAQLATQLAAVTEERDAWRRHAPDDREAAAIARCVKALDALNDQRTTYPSSRSVSVERILRYLADRYGVQR